MCVTRRSSDICSYKCRYYMDGSVFSLCNKYNEILKYDSRCLPLICEKCKYELFNGKEKS